MQGERLAAERTLASTHRHELTPADVRELIEGLGDMADVFADADPGLKAQVYADLGIRMVYRPKERVLAVEAAPRVCHSACRRGDLNPHALAGTSPSS